jgi:hypothetical protein
MYVVDRDGLDGLFAQGGEAQAGASALQVIDAERVRAASASGLQALADATRLDPQPPLEPSLASWSALAPLALVATEVPAETVPLFDTRIDDDREWVETPPTRIGRHARPTLQPPVSQRHGRITKRIVLSFVVGGAALTAAIILMALQSVGADEDARGAPPPEMAQVRRAASAGLATLAPHPLDDAPAGTPAELHPVLGATIPRRALARRPLTPPTAKLPGGRLQWRLPASFTLGGAAPDATDNGAVAALVATLVERCEPGTLVVTGHTCNVGPDLLNLVIGKRRAQLALDLLVADGLPARGVRVRSAAATHPEASNATPAGRIRNRRVTIACQPLRPVTQARGER